MSDVPRGLPVSTARKHWVLPGGAQREMSDAFLDARRSLLRLLQSVRD